MSAVGSSLHNSEPLLSAKEKRSRSVSRRDRDRRTERRNDDKLGRRDQEGRALGCDWLSSSKTAEEWGTRMSLIGKKRCNNAEMMKSFSTSCWQTFDLSWKLSLGQSMPSFRSVDGQAVLCTERVDDNCVRYCYFFHLIVLSLACIGAGQSVRLVYHKRDVVFCVYRGRCIQAYLSLVAVSSYSLTLFATFFVVTCTGSDAPSMARIISSLSCLFARIIIQCKEPARCPLPSNNASRSCH